MSRLDTMLGFLEQDPDDSFTRYAVGLEYAGMKEYPQALEYFNEVRRRDPAYVATYYQLGQVYCTLEKWDAAEEAFNAGVQAARAAQDLHALSELQAALDDLETMR